MVYLLRVLAWWHTFDTLIDMPTLKKRINVSVSKEVDQAVERLARRDQVPQATKAEHLIRLALELEEDEVLDTIASSRDHKGAKMVSHSDAWK
jgi:hypothetical protein